jgi:protein CpxP
MKKFIVALLALVVVATGVIFAVGQQSADAGHGKRGKRGGHHRGGGGLCLRGIELTEDQKARIKEIREASRTAIAPIRGEMKASREKLRALTANGAFDEAQVTAAANEQAAVSAKLIVQRQKVRSQIFALLTDEQKAKLAENKAKRTERRKARKEAKAEKVGE